jgi:cellulose synthase/poly-beta-1,6-N-acetylglucosamine synthase-like glycosyltransferase
MVWIRRLVIARTVSIVIPMYNAERYIRNVLDAIFSQDYPAPVEVIVVNDGSTDNSLEVVQEFEGRGDLRVIDQSNQGAVAATNNGFNAARNDVICSVDSDVVLHRDFLSKIMEEFDDPSVGAVQGYYKTPANVSFWAKMMGYDVEARYDSIGSRYVSHVCTGDTAYRRSAIEKTGLFDPAFIYGYDNDISYRLQKTGYKLVFRKDALCDHYWKANLPSYIKQQYHSAYGRMQIINKHKDKATGDSVSGLRMILQVPVTLLFFLLFFSGLALICSSAGFYLLWTSFVVLGGVLVDRTAFASGVYKKQKDPAAFLLPFVHFLRNVVWCWAFIKWGTKGLKRFNL